MGHPIFGGYGFGVAGLDQTLLEEEVAGAEGVGPGFGGGIEVHDLPLGGAVGGPGGDFGTVGIAVAGEVGPVELHLFGEGAVFGADGGLLAGVEGTEDVFDVVGVEGAGAGGVELVGGGGEVEAVAVDGSDAGLDLGFEPGPGGVGDEAVARRSRRRR